MRNRTVIFWVLILVFIDQLIKHIIRTNFMDMEFSIIPPLFYFLPKVNTEHSYINHLFKLGMNWEFHLIIRILCFFILLYLFVFFRKILPQIKVIQWGFVFGLAAAFCVLIDSVFWGGSLDYIYLKPLFIFDLKDIYANMIIILVLFGYFTLNKEEKVILGKAKLSDLFKKD